MEIEFLFDFLKAMLSLMIVFIALLFYMRFARNSRYKEDQKRKKDTIDFCFRDQINYEEIVFLTETSKTHKNFLAGEENPVKESQILLILTTFDKISIALKNNVYDEKIIIEYYSKYFLHFYSICRYFIMQRRESSRNPALFIEYEKLVRRWENDVDFFEKQFRYER